MFRSPGTKRIVALGFAAIVALSLGGCSMFGSSKSASKGPAKPVVTVAVTAPAQARGSGTPSTVQRTADAGLPGAFIPGAAAAGQRNPDYQLGPLDLVEVKVFQLPDLDRTARVDQNGIITLPLIGPVEAAGRTLSELESSIAQKYGESYLQSPRVTVFIKEYASQRVTVSGAVNGPGQFVLQGPTTLVEAIALAKGLNDIASTSDIALIRFVNGERDGQFHDLNSIIKGKTIDPVLKGGDIVFVQQSGLRATMKDLLQTSPVLSVIRGF